MQLPHNDIKKPMDVMREAVCLAEKGYCKSALEDLLWCWDEGAIVDKGFAAVRLSFLPSYLRRLSVIYPEAVVEIEQRLNIIQAQLDECPDNRSLIRDLEALQDACARDDETPCV